MAGADGPIETSVLLQDYHTKVFKKFAALREEQQSFPIDSKPALKGIVGTKGGGNDKVFHRVVTSQMRQAPSKEPQYHIQDMEPHQDTFELNQGGWIHTDPQLSSFTDKQWSPDVDYITYVGGRPGPLSLSAQPTRLTESSNPNEERFLPGQRIRRRRRATRKTPA